MPQRWVTRRDIEWRELAPPMRCFVEGAIVAEVGVRRVEECVAALLEPDERCVGVGDKRPIEKDGKLVGFIEISREVPV